MKTPLPKTIVIPADCYSCCLTYFQDELWSPEDSEQLMQDLADHAVPEPTTDDLREFQSAIRSILKTPLPNRRAVVAERWHESLQRFALGWLVSLRGHARRHALMRVSPRRLATWFEGGVQPGQQPWSEFVVALASTLEYSAWLAAGGDADIGRYIGIWAFK